MPLDPHDLRDAIRLWPQIAGATGRLINHSENHTFLFDGYTLRVHRPGYQSSQSIESELAWLQALRRDTDLPVAEPVPGADGKLLQNFATPLGERRHAVLFRFLRGAEPHMDGDLTGIFAKLGTYAARLHQHAMTWPRPPGFARQAWNAATILDADGLWGDWRIAPGVDGSNRPLIERAAETLRSDLATYGAGPQSYGLIHADMRLGNLLVDGDTVSLIDFDDSGFCWFTYDFAASVSFYETHPTIQALKTAWLGAYQHIRPLSPDDIASIDSMILLRRLALLAWIGTHSETKLAQQHMPRFAKGTADLAKRYLAGARD